MIAAWMLYAIVVSALVGLAAIACERMLRLADGGCERARSCIVS